MKDLAYFIGSCMHEDKCEQMQSQILDVYFNYLKKALTVHKNNIDSNAVEKDWYPMYEYAWIDFHRFYKGWSPGYYNPRSFSERLCKKILSPMDTASSKVSSIKGTT